MRSETLKAPRRVRVNVRCDISFWVNVEDSDDNYVDVIKETDKVLGSNDWATNLARVGAEIDQDSIDIISTEDMSEGEELYPKTWNDIVGMNEEYALEDSREREDDYTECPD